MPTLIPTETLQKIRNSFASHSIAMAALSGTFNMVHPNVTIREDGFRSLEVLMSTCKALGTNIITLCTGSRDPKDMWHVHPDNNSIEAWEDLCKLLEKAVDVAEREDVILAFEPELANVVNTAKKGRQLLNEMRSHYLKVVFDPANLFESGTKSDIQKQIKEGLDLLMQDIVIVHAKDRHEDGRFAAAGKGILPYSFFFKTLKEGGFDGDIIIHGLHESEAKPCFEFLQKQLFSL